MFSPGSVALGGSHLASGSVQADVQRQPSQLDSGRFWGSRGAPAAEEAWAHFDEVSQDGEGPYSRRLIGRQTALALLGHCSCRSSTQIPHPSPSQILQANQWFVACLAKEYS